MKTLILILLIGICSSAFGKNDITKKKKFLYKNDNTEVPSIKKKAEIEKTKYMLAYEYYYTVDWLYAETPFQHKLEAYA